MPLRVTGAGVQRRWLCEPGRAFVRRGAEAAVPEGGAGEEGGARGLPPQPQLPPPAHGGSVASVRVSGSSSSGGGSGGRGSGVARAGVYVGSRCFPAAWRTT